MNAVYAMTRNVYEWALPSIRSLAHFHPDARVFIVCEDDEFPLELPIKVETINVSGQTFFPTDGPNYKNQFTYINLLKVVYPALLPVKKVIHLDIDTIVCGKLDGLWKTDIAGKWFAAVPQYRGEFHSIFDRYYNMGVALINLAQMRKDTASDEMVEYLNTVKTQWADQDAWNMWADRAVPVPVRFNENWATGETNSPAIVHYCGIGDWFNNPGMYRGEYLEAWR